MSTVYTSVVYDLSLFGIENITSAMLTADKDSGVSIELSFDSGSTFRVCEMNEKFDVDPLMNHVVCRVNFNNQNVVPYTIETTGNFPMLSIGTSLFFKSAGGQVHQTSIGADGSYIISLPNLSYTVSYVDDNGVEVILDSFFIPKLRVYKHEPKAKEAMVEMFMRDLDWAKYTIFDVYENLDKISYPSGAQLDVYGNLIDTQTNSVCRWWALGFTDE